MARTGSGTVTSEAIKFQSDRSKGGQGSGDGPPARGIRVACTSASAVSLGARVPSLHGPTAYATIPAGEFREFINFDGNSKAPAINDLYLQGLSGTATYTFEVIA